MKRIKMAVAAGILIASVSGANPLATVHDSDFKKIDTDACWTLNGQPAPAQTAEALGALCSDSLVLTLTNLPPHAAVSIEMRVRCRGSWDGINGGDGPDKIIARLNDGRILLNTAISTQETAEQHYPERIPGVNHPGPTAIESVDCTWIMMVPHTADMMALEIKGVLRESLPQNQNDPGNESWSLKECKVSLAPPEFPVPGNEVMEKMWEGLSSPDAVRAWRAVDVLALGGAKTVDFIRGKMDERDRALPTMPGPGVIETLVKRMDQGGWEARAEASKKLSKLDARVVEELRRWKSDKFSIETNMQLDEIIGHISGCGGESKAETVHLLRLRYLLRLIGSPAAQEQLKRIQHLLPEEDAA